MDLAAKDSYIQKLASKVFSQRTQEPKKRPFAHFKGPNEDGPSKKKKKCKKKHSNEKADCEKKQCSQAQQKASTSPAVQRSVSTFSSVNGASTHIVKGGNVKSSFSTVDVLRKRLHEKIEESRGQGKPKEALSEAVQTKRAKRKLERERKKKKKKEFQMKKLAEASGKEQQPEIKQEAKPSPVVSKRIETALVFNKFDTVEEEYVDKMLKKKNKEQSIKGKLTPLTGKNYKQLLSRLQARKEKLEVLREKDEGKARQLEEKMKWTNTLYRAEGLKIKDNEDMLLTALKKKEKKRAGRVKRWDKRSEHTVEKMQQRQDKRKRNIQKRKNVKAEKKKNRARKKGRVLPEDLKKASV